MNFVSSEVIVIPDETKGQLHGEQKLVVLEFDRPIKCEVANNILSRAGLVMAPPELLVAYVEKLFPTNKELLPLITICSQAIKDYWLIKKLDCVCDGLLYGDLYQVVVCKGEKILVIDPQKVF